MKKLELGIRRTLDSWPIHMRKVIVEKILMKPSSVLLAILLVALGWMPFNSRADAEQNSGIWMMKASQGVLGSRESAARWWFDAHARYSDDANGFEQSIIRPGIGYALPKNHVVWAGYGWIANSPEVGDLFHEHRFWQQHSWKTSIKKFGFSSRSRLEQRFREGRNDDTGWRFRQFFKLTHPLGTSTSFYLSSWDEVFVNLNNTDWGADSGLDRNRVFMGVGWKPVAEGAFRTEVGYLNQFIYNSSGTDRIDHLLSLNVFLTF